MSEYNHSGCNGLTYPMEREDVVSLMQPRKWSDGTVNNSLIISEHVTLLAKGNTEVPEEVTDFHNQIRAAVNFDPYVADSTLGVFFALQSKGIWSKNARYPP